MMRAIDTTYNRISTGGIPTLDNDHMGLNIFDDFNLTRSVMDKIDEE